MLKWDCPVPKQEAQTFSGRVFYCMDSTPVFVLYTNDGSKIVETIKTSLEKCDTMVYTANVLQTDAIDPPPCCATMLFLTPGMLSVLKSSRSPDLTYVQQNSKFCVLFYHDTININRESVQELLRQKLPAFPKWTVDRMVRKVQKFILQILELLETENEEADPDLDLVSNFRFYPDTVWKQNQDVFISFDSEIPAGDQIMVEVDGGMFEARRINPYTYAFTFADCFGSGERSAAVLANGDILGTELIVVKDGYQTLLDEISDVTSPLHFIQEILTTTQGNEGQLKSEMTNMLILEGTKNLLKRLHEKSDKTGEGSSQIDQTSGENAIMPEESENIVRRRSSRLTTRRRRALLGNTHKRQSQRISRAQEYLSVEDNFPSIKSNSELLKSLPPDFFDHAQ